MQDRIVVKKEAGLEAVWGETFLVCIASETVAVF